MSSRPDIASSPYAQRQLSKVMMRTATSGTVACPKRKPNAANDVALPRLRMNQLAIATVVPSWTPAMAKPRPAPKNIHICHGVCMNARPTIAPATTMPATAVMVRVP